MKGGLEKHYSTIDLERHTVSIGKPTFIACVNLEKAFNNVSWLKLQYIEEERDKI